MQRFFQLERGCHLRDRISARLFRGLTSYALPSFDPLHRSSREMRFRSLGNEGSDLGDPELGTFLNRPLHTIKFEDRDQDSDIGGYGGGYVIPKIEFDPPVFYARDPAMTSDPKGNDVEFLSYLRAQDARQMLCVGSR